MRRTFLKNYPVLTKEVKQELTTHLLKSNPDCVIGIGIRIYLQKKDGLDELIRELQDLALVNPEYMKEVIGHEAMDLLFPS